MLQLHFVHNNFLGLPIIVACGHVQNIDFFMTIYFLRINVLWCFFSVWHFSVAKLLASVPI